MLSGLLGIVKKFMRERLRYHRISRRLLLETLSRYYKLLGKESVHFLHIGKTGGTAIKEALKHFSEHGNLKIWLHGHEVKLSDIPRGDKVVIFIRDPISRFVSGFYSRMRQGRPRYNAPWTPGEAQAFRIFKTPNELAKSLSASDPNLRKAAVKAMKNIRHVNTFLSDWLISKEYLLKRREDILFIGCQESLDQDFEILKKLLKLPPEITLPKDPVKAHKNPLHVNKNLEEKAVENLRKWYTKDYELYDMLLKVRSEILKKISERGKS